MNLPDSFVSLRLIAEVWFARNNTDLAEVGFLTNQECFILQKMDSKK
jgi:hypothetical protein